MKQLLILSGKGGTGKTTVASAFIKLLEAKAYADCDVDAPNLHLLSGQDMVPEQEDFYGLKKAVLDHGYCDSCGACESHCRFDAISTLRENGKVVGYEVDDYGCEGCGVCEAVCPTGAIKLMPSSAGELKLYRSEQVFSTAKLKMGNGTTGMLVTEVKKRMKDATENISDTAIAVIDGSPGIGCPVIASISGVDMILIVAEPSVSGISDMKRIVETAGVFRTPICVCVNKWDISAQNTSTIIAFCEEQDIPYIGRIPYDSSVVEAVNNGLSIADIQCKAGDAVAQILEQVVSRC